MKNKYVLFAAYLQGKRDQIYWPTKWEELEPIGRYRIIKKFLTWFKSIEQRSTNLSKYTN